MPTKLEARVSRHDREIAAIRKLIVTGMEILVKSDQNLLRLEGAQVAMREDLRQLAAAQRETDRQLKGLIRALERGRNGHTQDLERCFILSCTC